MPLVFVLLRSDDGIVSSPWLSLVFGVGCCVRVGASVGAWCLCCLFSSACICLPMASLVRFSFCDVSCFLFAVLVVDCSWSSRVRSLEVRCSMSFWVLLMSVLVLFRESFIWACVLAVIFSELCV